VFAAGDYAGASMFGDAATWQHHAACALVRGDEGSFAALSDFAEPAARFHAAAARWIHGDTARARRELFGLDLPHARALAALLARDRIHVLAQLPWVPDAMTDLAGGARADGHFVVRTIGHRAGDVPNRPYLDVRRCLDDGFAPDFFVAAMAEWHHLPPNLQALPCPRFCHVADHDLHVQTVRPWLDLFDELCVTDRTEWLDVQGLGRGGVTSFPKVFGLPALPSIVDGERHLDSFVSGTMLDPYHPDKARVLHELLAMPDIALRVVRGFTGPLAFHALLAASKASFTFVRRPGAMPTRGLESLAFGCAVALQRESVLRLWVTEREGAVAYGPEPGALAAAVRTIVQHWDAFGPAARRGAALVREQFALPRVASQYLRFLAFRAAAPRRELPEVDTARWVQKRVCVTRTWLPADPAVRRRSMQASFRRLGALAARRPYARTIVDMARELLCEHAFYDQRDRAGPDERALLADATALLEQACRLFPDHLAARFLLVRTLWHHGDAKQRMRALQLAHDALEADVASWRIDPRDDVMPFDFHADCFDYRHYLELVAAAEKGVPVEPEALARLVLASLAGYVARKTDKPALHALAVQLDPGFARYRLDLARCLLRRGGMAERRRALALLHELADGSAEFAAAARELLRAGEALSVPTARALARLDGGAIDAGLTVEQLFAIAPAAVPDEDRDCAVGGVPAVAVVVPFAGDARELPELLAELADQTAAPALEVLVACTPAGADAHVAAAVAAANAVRARAVPVGAGASWAQRLDACAAAAAAPLLTVAMPGVRLRGDALDVLRRVLGERPDASVVCGSDGFTTAAPARFDPSACAWFAVAPPDDPFRVGLFPLWRRELQVRHGGFAANDCADPEGAFWRRAAGTDGALVRLPALLAILPLGSRALALRGGAPAHAVPATLLAPGIREEATSHARLGVIPDALRRDLCSLEQFLGTVLLHGDLATASCLLRAAIAAAPQLLSPRLALAQLRAAYGEPAAEVLEAARGCAPYAAVVDRHLAALRSTHARPRVHELPRPALRPEPQRCPS
jgi:hypothetical protein